jgi:hypothetical protein
MTTATHYANANFLRELAENLPRISPQSTPDQAELLQQLADEQLQQAEYDEWVRKKVAAARADDRPRLTTAQMMARMNARVEQRRNAV